MTAEKHDLREWVETYAADLVGWAAFKLSDEELARDIVQDTFLVAAEKIGDFKGKSSPRTWLFAILNHKIIEIYRKKARTPIPADEEILTASFGGDGMWDTSKRPQPWDTNDPNLLDDEDFRAVLKKCMEALPAKWNACMKMKYLLNKNGDEICQELGITPTNFWQMMHRAKLNLRECIDRNWFQY